MESKPFILVELPCCEENKNDSKHFIEKFEALTNPSCVIYRGKCSCGKEYIVEIDRNVEKRWSEPNNPAEETEPARHLLSNISHLFAWEILMPAPRDKRTCKNLEAF